MSDGRLFETRDPFHRGGGPPAPARSSDPKSSWEAAARLERSGGGSRQRLFALNAVRRFPGMTSRELAEAVGSDDRYLFSRRLPELEKSGHVRRGPDRVCAIGRGPAAVWFAVDPPPA